MNITKADSLTVDSSAWFSTSKLRRRLIAERISAPIAPIAPPSVGVAMPRKIVPSTRKTSARGGIITMMTCRVIGDSQRPPVARSATARISRTTTARVAAQMGAFVTPLASIQRLASWKIATASTITTASDQPPPPRLRASSGRAGMALGRRIDRIRT